MEQLYKFLIGTFPAEKLPNAEKYEKCSGDSLDRAHALGCHTCVIQEGEDLQDAVALTYYARLGGDRTLCMISNGESSGSVNRNSKQNVSIAVATVTLSIQHWFLATRCWNLTKIILRCYDRVPLKVSFTLDYVPYDSVVLSRNCCK